MVKFNRTYKPNDNAAPEKGAGREDPLSQKRIGKDIYGLQNLYC